MRLFTILCTLLFLFSVTVNINAQDARDWSKKPLSFNNPLFTQGDPTDALVYFTESFENAGFPPAGWLKANPDGGTGWNRQVAGTSPLPGWNGGTITTPAGGGNAVAFATWNTGGAIANDQYLITPQITVVSGDELNFWMQVPGYTNAYLDNVDIRISTTGTAPANFSTVVAALVFPAGSVDTLWKEYTYTLTNFVPAGSNIYIAFREHVADNLNDGAAVLLDLVTVRPFVPVELTSFAASVIDADVTLHWTTATEVNNKGFEIERSFNGAAFSTVGFVSGSGTTTEIQNYAYTERNLEAGHYIYRLKQVDFEGTFEYSDEVEADISSPASFALSQNYPNPFNPSTKISFSLAADSKVSLKIFDVIGQEVKTLVNSDMSAGTHNLDFDASALNSGVYFYRIDAQGINGENFSSVKKMILSK